jgi:hypothetical protein
MKPSVQRLGAALVVGLALLGVPGTPAHAQYLAPPGAPVHRSSAAHFGPYATLVAAPHGHGPYARLAASTYGPYGVYGHGWYGAYPFNPAFANPYYGYLHGVAAVTTANAQYWKTIQEARLIREQGYRSALETRRRMIEEAEWERDQCLRRTDPNLNYQRDQEAALDRARHDPPLTEILSARALNDLFRHLAKMQGRGERGPAIPLDQDLLRRINVTGQDPRANIGLLRDGGQLHWPLPLEDAEFKDGREHLNHLLTEAVHEARSGNAVDPTKLREVEADLGLPDSTLLNAISGMSPSQYIEAKRYLNLIEDAVRALKEPKVGNYFNDNWVAKGNNVAELVLYMSEKGLLFAPAVPGDADAYRALYHALQAFDAGMTSLTSDSRRNPG